jgi:TfoX/Sxy family transcriptional regulator of competence genes
VAYSEELAKRVRRKLAGTKGLTEQEMFGGLTFLVAGNICCGVSGDDLMVKVRPDLHQDALTRPHTREAASGGRAVRGTIYVDRYGWDDATEFELWVNLGVAHARAQPPKARKKAGQRGRPKSTAARAAKAAAQPAKKRGPAKKRAPVKKKAPVKKAQPAKRGPAKKRAKR